MLNNPVSEKIEIITWSPGLQDTTDKEAATNTIEATSEASGVGNADYSAALTLAAPSDARLAVAQIAARLAVTIDSDDGTHDLRCRVYVDAQDANHMLFDVTYSTTGAQLSVSYCTSATLPAVFNLLKDGAAHTFYFFFWSPGNHSPVISVVELWECVGTGARAWDVILTLTHTGLVTILPRLGRTGTGNFSVRFNANTTPTTAASEGKGCFLSATVAATEVLTSGLTGNPTLLCPGAIAFTGDNSVETDLGALLGVIAILRSE